MYNIFKVKEEETLQTMFYTISWTGLRCLHNQQQIEK